MVRLPLVLQIQARQTPSGETSSIGDGGDLHRADCDGTPRLHSSKSACTKKKNSKRMQHLDEKQRENIRQGTEKAQCDGYSKRTRSNHCSIHYKFTHTRIFFLQTTKNHFAHVFIQTSDQLWSSLTPTWKTHFAVSRHEFSPETFVGELLSAPPRRATSCSFASRSFLERPQKTRECEGRNTFFATKKFTSEPNKKRSLLRLTWLNFLRAGGRFFFC